MQAGSTGGASYILVRQQYIILFHGMHNFYIFLIIQIKRRFNCQLHIFGGAHGKSGGAFAPLAPP